MVSTSITSIDLAASSSSTILGSIYGSQVSQLNISQRRNEEKCEDFPIGLVAKRSSCTMRPRSAMVAGESKYNRRIIQEYEPNRTITAPQPLRHNSSESKTTAGQSLSLTSLILDEKKANSDKLSGSDNVRKLSRPKSSFPRFQNHKASVKFKRPKTASAIMSESHLPNSRGAALPILSHPTTPVVLSSTPQYFDFWNEKPLKPREWSTQQFAYKKWTRPKSSAITQCVSSRSKLIKKSHGNKGDLIDGGSVVNNSLDIERTDDKGSLHKLDSEIKTCSEETENENKRSTDHNAKGNMSEYWKGSIDDDKVYNVQQLISKVLNNDEFRSSNAAVESCPLPVHSGLQDCKENGSGFLNFSNDSNLVEDNKSDNDVMHDKEKEENDHEFDENNADMFGNNSIGHSLTTASWLLSSGNTFTTRFELPIDMKSLENMTPMEYLVLHCKLSNQKRHHYSKVFKKVCKQVNTTMTQEEVIIGIFYALHEVVPIKDAEKVCKDLTLTSSNLLITNMHFSCICAVAERLYGRHYLPFELSFREVIEVVDFEALAWKLQGLNIPNDLRVLLFKLSN